MMRVQPTAQQIEYLNSIGASDKATPPEAGPDVLVDHTAANDMTGNSRRLRRCWWWLVVWFLAALVIAGTCVVRGEEPALQACQDQTPASGECFEAVIFFPDYFGEGGALPRTAEQPTPPIPACPEKVFVELETLRIAVDDLHAEMDGLSAETSHWKSIIEDRTLPKPGRNAEFPAEALGTAIRRFETTVQTTGLAVATRGKQVLWATIGLVAVTVVGVGGLLITQSKMIERLAQLEWLTYSGTFRSKASDGDGLLRIATPRRGEKAMDHHHRQSDPAILPLSDHRRPPVGPLTTEVLDLAKGFCDRAADRSSCGGSWRLGMASITGNVRSENQDYGVCFDVNDRAVLIVADGCGGLPFGQRAAYLASLTAAVTVACACGAYGDDRELSVQAVALDAILSASGRLAIEGERLGITEVRGGLRTTLIVLVAFESEVGYAYIGDGGGCLIRTTGEIEHFVDPQKASSSALHLLAASLGPTIEGTPVCGKVTRKAGDLVIVGSDGVFDRVEGSFPKDVMCGCLRHDGDLQATAQRIVEELAAYQDDAGYVCDDNLTLGIMGDGTRPTLSYGYWSQTEPEQSRGVDPEL